MKECKHQWCYFSSHRVCSECRTAEFYEPGGVMMVDDITKVPMDYDKSYDAEEIDPNGVEQHEKGCKKDKGKPDASLLGMFGKALLAVAEVGTYGAEKYTRGGWESVSDGINRYTAAMLRHFFKERYEDYDTDLPVLHAAQVSWNALARLELMLREKDSKKMKHKNIGDSFDSFLEDEGILEEVKKVAIKRNEKETGEKLYIKILDPLVGVEMKKYYDTLVMSQYRKPKKNWLYRKGKDGRKIWIIYPEEGDEEENE